MIHQKCLMLTIVERYLHGGLLLTGIVMLIKIEQVAKNGSN